MLANAMDPMVLVARHVVSEADEYSTATANQEEMCNSL